MTLSIARLSIMTLSIATICHHSECFYVVTRVILYAECHYVIMPNVVMLNAGMLSVMGHHALLSFIMYLFLPFSISLAQLPSSK
jgi:hypothetical protein